MIVTICSNARYAIASRRKKARKLKNMGEDEHGTIRAPLRWAGSKRKSLHALREFLPLSVKHYVEPFAGSACLAYLLRPESLTIGDINPQLIEFYTYLKNSPSELYDIYSNIRREPDTYYRIRSEYNDDQPSLERAAKFLYLNRQCFNGIYRVNSRGRFNVPWGGDKVGKPLQLPELIRASAALEKATLICGDFEDVVMQSVDADTFVYLDPPYASDESRVFREYHEESFATDDWSRLLRALEFIHEKGGHFLLSYAGSSAFTKELGSWNAGFLDVTRNVGGFRASRRKYREFLATNYTR